MKKGTNLMKRVLSFVMAFAMMLTLVPTVAFAAKTPTTLYLKPNANWTQASARFAAYFFGNGETWVSMTDTDGDGIYEVAVPSGYPSVIFCRMNPGNETNSWDYKWNQSPDLAVPTDGTNCYTVADGTWDSGGGTWSTVTPEPEPDPDPEPEPEPDPVTYTVYCINSANWDAVAAYAWIEGGVRMEWPGVPMTKTDETVNGFDVYSATFDVAYENVIFNNNGKGSQTDDLVFSNGQYYDVKSGAWYESLEKVPVIDPLTTDVYLVGSFNSWSTTANEFKLDAEESQTGYVSLELEAGTEYEFKVVQKGSWTSCATPITGTVANLVFSSSVNNDAKITTTIAGTYVFAFDVSGSTLSVTYPKAEEPDPEPPTDPEPEVPEATYIIAGTAGLCGVAWDAGNAANAMTLNAETGLYEKTYESVPKGTHSFKVTDGTWDNSWGGSGAGGNYEFTLDAISNVTITFDASTKAITVTHKATGEVAESVDSFTLHYRNTGLWETVNAYGWLSGTSTNVLGAWPGTTVTENAEHPNWYTVELSDLAENSGVGILFNNGSDAGKTGDIMIKSSGEYWYDGQLLTEAPESWNDGSVENVTYEVTLHFANAKNWGSVNLYTWTAAGNPTGSWPGTAAGLDADGFYSLSFTYEAPEGQGLNFIFNGGGSQTVDLALAASDFVNNKAEKWVVPTTTDAEGKYYADIVSDPGAIAISPVVNGTSVTFAYKAENASSVSVAGTMNSWAPAAMTKNDYGVWSVTLENVAYGIHEYKFVVNNETPWRTDPLNSWQRNGNSAFLISNPDQDTNEVKVNVHFDAPSAEWNVCAWGAPDLKDQYDFENDVTTITLDGRASQYVAFKVRKSIEGNDWAEQSGEIRVGLGSIVSGTIDVWVDSNFAVSQTLNDDVVYANKVSSVELDYDNNTITVKTSESVSDPETAFAIFKDGADARIIDTVTASGSTYTLTLKETLSLVTLYQYTLRFSEQVKFTDKDYIIGINTVYASDKFAAEFTYDGELGADWSADSTTFTVWAPTAASVSVNLYTSGTAGTDDLIRSVPMAPIENGAWTATVEGDLNGTYYTYAVNVDGDPVEAVDPYARTTGVNGQRGMVIDLDSTDPAGWADDKNPNPITSYTDAIIYELHVRDFSIDDSSGVSEANRGKYLAFTEKGTTTANGAMTGIDYLDDLGITHLHLLPVYDYGSVDETKCENFNWGYDPVNYNTPEGSYSTNPYDGAVRVKEFKQMVKALHDADISVIMDVVYNHVYDAGKFCMNQIVPNYFSRVNADGSFSNGSGCGNDTASEREMVRKYIVESVLYWHQEYHIDGFRFDLVGLLDGDTINQIVTEVHMCCPDVIFYGEGWTLGTAVEPGNTMATQANSAYTPEFAYFSDTIRNLLAGSNGTSLGFVSGQTGQETAIKDNFMASPWWTNNPQQVIQYASCHDNYTLIDKIVKSTGASGINDNIKKMSNLAAAVYLTAQGVPFIHAGEEFFREKLEENGDRCENSYNASDLVNHIEWSNLENADYAANVDYYQGLIEFRKAHPALRMDNAGDIQSGVTTNTASGNVVAMFIDGCYAEDDDIFVIFNANNADKSVSLPEGTWTINVKGNQAGTASLGTASGSVTVEAISAMVLTKADEGQDENTGSDTDHDAPPAGYKTIYFTNNKGWSTVYAYAWTGTTNHLGAWPGTEMTYLETNGYGEAIYYTIIPTSAANIIFNNGTDQTVALTCGIDGTGYYCTDKNSEGNYEVGTYTFRTSNLGDAEEYFLIGYINSANYVGGDYKFDANGTVTTTFSTDSYVYVVNGDLTETYMTDGFLGSVTSAKLVNVSGFDNLSGYDKLMVPGGVEVTFTLTVNDNDTVTLSYEADTLFVEDESGIQDGVTLHCWNWSFAEIEAKMADIAAAGYTAIQTSPIQPLKETTSGVSSKNWWVYYQPVDFEINTAEGNALGTKDELVSMIETAHEYGIQVIVDVVANHLANERSNDLSPEIPDKIRNNSAYWHDYTVDIQNYKDRTDITQHCMGGLPDLNTANDDVQEMVLDFLKECIDAGVDGFRFDAAKHIETPEDTVSSDFWPTVIGGAEAYAKARGKDLYVYGELLYNADDAGTLPISAYTKYMAVTDNVWSNNLRESISSGTAAIMEGYYKPVDASQLVLWAESHDTYANDGGESQDENEAEINKTWALVAARADAMGLYFARPASLNQALGIASATGWDNAEVKAVNEFHNAFAGKSEYIDTEDGIIYVERGTSGVVLVNASGTTATVEVAANKIDDGTYIDQITGNTFTVANGTISGEIGDTGIAVVYNAEELIDLEGATMTLGNSLAMNFVIDTAELTGTDNYAVITKEYADGTGSKSVTINQADWNVYDGTMYYFTYSKVAAKEMTDKITVVVYNSAGEAVTNSWTDSVRDYCMRAIKAEEEGSKNMDKLTLYVDMLNYGAAAQTEFGDYHSDDLATSQLTEAQKAYATGDVNAEDHRVTDTGYLGSTLTLGNEIELNFIFDNTIVTQDMYAIATYTNHYGKEKSVTIEGSAFGEYNKDNVNGWYIPVANMSVADGCQVNGESKFMVTCTVYNADGTVVTSARDSVASYVARANANTNNTNPLYTLILKFATSAYNYFH